MNDKLTPFCQDIMRSANRNGIDAQCNLPDWVIAEITRGIVETIWMYQRGAVTPTQMVRELVGEEAARREAEAGVAAAVEQLAEEHEQNLRNEAARREAEARPYVAQARLQDEPPGPRTGPSKEGAGVPRFLYPIDDELGRTTSADGVSPFAAAASSAPQGEREGPGSAAAPAIDPACNHVRRSQGMAYPRTCQSCGLGPCKNLIPEDKPVPAADDLVRRLRKYKPLPGYGSLLSDAADRIETETARADRAEAENSRLRGALTEIRDRHIPDQPSALDIDEADYVKRQYGELRRIASAALARGGDNG